MAPENTASDNTAAQVHRRRDGDGHRSWRAALVEVTLVTVVLLLFIRLHAAAGTDVGAATANALSLQAAEQGLRVDIELTTNRWLTGHAVLVTPAVLIYRLYYVVLLGVLLWAFLRHRAVYRHVRRTLVVMCGLALLVFWALPVSPPRFALPGIVDVIADHDIVGSQPSRDLSSGVNHFSAMPSLHVGWSAWCAYAVWLGLRTSHPRAAALAWLFPILMAIDVLATGNHYVLDLAGSAVLLIVAIAVATGWARFVGRRPADRLQSLNQ